MTDAAAGAETMPCRICGTAVAKQGVWGSSNPRFECRVCGTYELSEYAAQRLYEVTGAAHGRLLLLPNHHLLSAALRDRFERAERQPVRVRSFDELVADARPLPGGYLEAVDRLLLYVGDHLPHLGSPVHLTATADYPLAWARDGGEFEHIAQLGVELGYLRVSKFGSGTVSLQITAQGWKRLQQLREQRSEHRRAFVAMWFAPEMTPAYLIGIAPALRATGYEPLRIDAVQHNGKIDDQIVASIRRSGLLVAEFTGNRGGVYFEAGFAMGLGIPVIWTCRADAVGELHFDTRQYNHIVWTTPEDLRESLRLRIEATLPTYPPIAEPDSATAQDG